MAQTRSGRRKRNIAVVGGSFGNFVEWYDWGIFGVLAATFGAQIFYAENDVASLLQTLATFAVGFAARPLGAIFLSPLGDKLGRKRLLSLAILMMAGGSLVLGLTPSYEVIGIWAPVIFVTARVVQGISAGAEFQGGSSFIVEHSAEGKRGMFGSIMLISSILGTLAATATGAIVTNVFDPETLAAWGWRLPFILGAIFGLIGLYLRQRADETPAFEQAAQDRELVRTPLSEVIRYHKLTMLRIFGISTYTGAYYLWTVFLPTYAHLASGLPLAETLVGGIIALVVMVIALPFIGLLSDRIGRKPVLLTYSIGMALLAYPMLVLLERPSFGIFLAVDITGCLLIGCVSATQSTTYVEMTYTETRTTAIGVPYNISSALVGGTMPLIATALITSGSGRAVAFIIIGIAIFAGIIVATMPEVRGRDIAQTSYSPKVKTGA